MTLLSLFSMVLSPSRGLLRNAVSLRLWNGRYVPGMPSVVFSSCLLLCCLWYPPPVPGLSQCGIWSASSVSIVGLCTRVGRWSPIHYWDLYSHRPSERLPNDGMDCHSHSPYHIPIFGCTSHHISHLLILLFVFPYFPIKYRHVPYIFPIFWWWDPRSSW